eukprot:489823_1
MNANQWTLRQGACHMCGSLKHWSRDCPDRDKCFKCGGTGHWSRDCPNWRNNIIDFCDTCQTLGHISKFCPERLRCYGCGEIGHYKRVCPRRIQYEARGTRKYGGFHRQRNSNRLNKRYSPMNALNRRKPVRQYAKRVYKDIEEYLVPPNTNNSNINSNNNSNNNNWNFGANTFGNNNDELDTKDDKEKTPLIFPLQLLSQQPNIRNII